MSRQAPPSVNITHQLYQNVKGIHRATVETTQPGLIAGTEFIAPSLAPANAGSWKVVVKDGQIVNPGDILVEIEGTVGG